MAREGRLARSDCRLYLIIDTAGPLAVDEAALRRVLGAGDVACVLLRGGDRLPELVQAAKAMDVTVLIDGDACNAKSVGADGVHLRFSGNEAADRTAVQAARAILKETGVVGVFAGLSRHDAMVAGEAGADYVAIGGDDHDSITKQVAWWAELFEVPCVAWDIGTPRHAADLAVAGADFVAVRVSGRELAAEVAAYRDAVAGREAER